MFKKMSSMFVLTTALVAVTANAQDRADPGTMPPKAITAKKAVLDPTKKLDVVETAKDAGSFNKLSALLKEAELVETLKGTGPFTVFAPTDEAFAKLPKATVESLLKPENREKADRDP